MSQNEKKYAAGFIKHALTNIINLAHCNCYPAYPNYGICANMGGNEALSPSVSNMMETIFIAWIEKNGFKTDPLFPVPMVDENDLANSQTSKYYGFDKAIQRDKLNSDKQTLALTFYQLNHSYGFAKMWQGEYGRLRCDLLLFMYHWVEDYLNEHQ